MMGRTLYSTFVPSIEAVRFSAGVGILAGAFGSALGQVRDGLGLGAVRVVDGRWGSYLCNTDKLVLQRRNGGVAGELIRAARDWHQRRYE